MTPDSPSGTAGSVGFIGLGAMGSPMSRRLLGNGWDVVGYDLDAAAGQRHVDRGGRVVSELGDFVGQVPVIVTSLPSAGALASVITSLGRSTAGQPLILVETSTLALPEKVAARELATSLGIELVDCPVSGTSAQAENGDLVAYLSGSEQVVARARPVVEGMTRAVYLVGEFGNGTKMKLVANLLVAVHNLAAAEALLLAERAGLDLDLVLQAVGDGAGGSRMLSVRGPLMIAEDFDKATVRVDLFQKDLRAIQALSVQLSSPTPLLAASVVYYDLAMAQGRARQDTASVFGVLKQAAQPAVPPLS